MTRSLTSTAATQLDPKRLRRAIIGGNGLHRRNAFGRGTAGVLKTLSQLGYAQIDTISVVERAHHHVLRSRVQPYRSALLDRLVHERTAFEYWFHAAAFLPMADYRFARPRMDAVRRGELHFRGPRDRKLMKRVLDRIRIDGPLKASDFEGKRGAGGWWAWKPAKQALEILFLQGDLMVTGRDGFQKRYDLAERVLPPEAITVAPTAADEAAHLVDQCLRLFASVTVPEATYLRRSAPLREAVKKELAEREARGDLFRIDSQGASTRWVERACYEAAPRVQRQVHVLSPFDPLVIQRSRTRELIGFDYQLECYVPAAKRQHGYFSLPLLWGDTFLGRMDCKAERDRAVLRIHQLTIEDQVEPNWQEPLCKTLTAFAGAQACERVAGGRALSAPLRAMLKELRPGDH